MRNTPAVPPLIIGLVGLYLTLATPPVARAGYMLVPDSFEDRASYFKARFDWDFPAGNQTDSRSFVGPRQDWTVNLGSTSGLFAGTRFLTITPQHHPGTELADPGHGPNSEPGDLLFGIERPPVNGPVYNVTVRGDRIKHGAQPHFDFFIGVVKAPFLGDVRIDVRGQHVRPDTTKPFEASFENFSSVPLTGTIIPSYGPTGVEPIELRQEMGTIEPGKSFKKALPKEAYGLKLTDYRIEIYGSAKTDTHLAFLGTTDEDTGIVDLDLSPMTELMMGSNPFLVPVLREMNLAQDLYVFVDLLQFLGSETTFSPMQTYDIVDGLNDLLPGYFVSNTPITQNEDGSLSGDPFTGDVFASGGIDGQVVPEPSTILMLAVGFAMMLGYARKRTAARPRA